MGMSKVETNGFEELPLNRIMTHQAEAMAELRFQFGEGLSACFSGVSLDEYGNQIQALQTGDGGLLQCGAGWKYHEPGSVRGRLG